MANRGTPALNTSDPKAWNSHAKFLELAPKMNDVELAVYFRLTVPTVRKWRRLPLGYQPKTGRRSGAGVDE